MKLTSLENIPEKVLDTLVEKYGNDPNYRVNDDRARLSFGKRREYFLISNHLNRASLEWTFIWIDNGLWQFRYLNTQCGQKVAWENPLDILNKLLND